MGGGGVYFDHGKDVPMRTRTAEPVPSIVVPRVREPELRRESSVASTQTARLRAAGLPSKRGYTPENNWSPTGPTMICVPNGRASKEV